MIKINLLKPKVKVYDDLEPGGIIDIENLKSKDKINPILFEVLWDKEEFNKKMKEKKDVRKRHGSN